MRDAASLACVPAAPTCLDDLPTVASNEVLPAPVTRPLAPTVTGAPDREPRAEDPAVITIEELADFLRVNHKTVREAIARGEIPGVRRIGGTIRVYRAAVVDWLAAGQGRVSHSKRLR